MCSWSSARRSISPLALYRVRRAGRRKVHFEAPLAAGGKTRGVILSDQVKNLDWRARKAAFVERAADEVVAEVTARIVALVEPE